MNINFQKVKSCPLEKSLFELESYNMTEEVLSNVLDWCFENTNILDSDFNNNNNGERLIHFAAEKGYYLLVKQLLEKGVSPELKDVDGNKPLHIASYDDEEELVEVAKLLLQNGADPNSINGNKDTPIYLATERGHAEIVNLLIQHGANVNSLNNRYCRTPLHMASRKGHLEITKLLIENGAEVNQPDKDSETPLLLASQRGNIEVAKLLLEKGANVESSEADDNWTPLHYASDKENVEMVNLLLQKSANVNCQSKIKSTPLHFVSKSGNLEIVQILILNGASINCEDIKKGTPLHLASKYGHTNIAQLLILNGANINHENAWRITPLHLASAFGRSEIVTMLLEIDVCLTLKTKDGKTALEIAKEKNQKIIYRMIYEKIVESMSSKGNSMECSKDECQRAH